MAHLRGHARIFLLITIALKALLIATVNSSHGQSAQPFSRVCYLRPDKYFPLDLAVRMNLCTHIIVAFSSLDYDGRVKQDFQFENFCQLCRQIIDHRRSSSKLMFSIGGGGEVNGFALATSSVEHRKRLVDSILMMIERCALDGVDIDWEFPSWGHNISRKFERDNFLHLLKDIRERFDQYRLSNGRNLLLSAAVAAQITIIHLSYRPREMSKYVNFINLMTYDFYVHKWYWPFIGHNSALHARPAMMGIGSTFNTEWAAQHWHLLGLRKEQIMVGIPTYGKRFTLYSKYLNYPGAIAVSSNADCTYSDVCDFLNLNDTVQEFDLHSKVPYAYNGYDWISYENELSAEHKARWIKNNYFGGAMIFSLNADDFRLRCGKQPFPIHSTILRVLG